MTQSKAQLMQNLRDRLKTAGLLSRNTTVDMARRLVEDSERFETIVRDTVGKIQSELPKSFPAIYSKCDWSESRSRSRGGKYEGEWRSRLNDHDMPTGPGINIAMRRRTQGEAKVFGEYEHLTPFGDVGSYRLQHREENLILVTIHEVAHSIDFTCSQSKAKAIRLFGERLTLPQLEEARPHGIRFIRIYSRLRHGMGYIDTAKPLSSELSDDMLSRVENWRRIPVDVAAWAKDREAYTKEQRRLQQKARREAAGKKKAKEQ